MVRRGLTPHRLRSSALLVRRVAYGESDQIVTLFTEQAGALGAIARGARRSQRRFAGLEPMHLLRVELDANPHRDLATLVEAEVARPRLQLTGALDRLEAAGRALRWLRRAAPPRTAEPALWSEINGLLDRLDGPLGPVPPAALLGATGLRLLEAAGWGLDLRRCVRCETPCPERARAYLDVEAGGIVCRRCGGGGLELDARTRRHLLRACEGNEAVLRPEDAATAIELVERGFAAHAPGGAG